MFESTSGEGGSSGLFNKILSVFNKGKDEVVRSTKISKVRMDLSSIKKERELIFKRLGEEVSRRHKEKTLSIPGLDPFFSEIDTINHKLSLKDRELKDLRGEENLVIKSAALDVGADRVEKVYKSRSKKSISQTEVF